MVTLFSALFFRCGLQHRDIVQPLIEAIAIQGDFDSPA